MAESKIENNARLIEWKEYYDYLTHQYSDQKMHFFEKSVAESAFDQEALDGLDNFAGVSMDSDLIHLRDDIHRKVLKTKPKQESPLNVGRIVFTFLAAVGLIAMLFILYKPLSDIKNQTSFKPKRSVFPTPYLVDSSRIVERYNTLIDEDSILLSIKDTIIEDNNISRYKRLDLTGKSFLPERNRVKKMLYSNQTEMMKYLTKMADNAYAKTGIFATIDTSKILLNLTIPNDSLPVDSLGKPVIPKYKKSYVAETPQGGFETYHANIKKALKKARARHASGIIEFELKVTKEGVPVEIRIVSCSDSLPASIIYKYIKEGPNWNTTYTTKDSLNGFTKHLLKF